MLALLSVADDEERERALETLELISDRGFARRRNLKALWKKVLAQAARRSSHR